MKKRTKIILLVVILALLLAGAGTGIGVYIYNKDVLSFDQRAVDKAVNQPDGNIYDRVLTFNRLVDTDNAEYYFYKDISKGKINRFVTYAEQAIEHIDIDDKMTIYVCPAAFPTVFKDEDYNAIFIDNIKQHTKSIELIQALLHHKYAAYSNYGLMYGMSADIHKQLGWGKVSTESNKKLAAHYSSYDDSDKLDLVYPLFMTEYASKKDIKMAKSLSVKYVNFLIENYGYEYLHDLAENSASFDSEFEFKFYVTLNKFINTIDIKAIASSPAAILRYAPYSKKYPLIIESKWARYLIHGTFVADFELHYIDIFSYSGIRRNLSIAEQDMISVRGFLEIEQSFDLRVKCYIDQDTPAYAYYDDKMQSIHIKPGIFSSLIHEYTRFLEVEYFNNLYFQNYGLAEYCISKFGSLFKEYMLANTTYYLVILSDDMSDSDKEYYSNSYKMYTHPDRIDYMQVRHLQVYLAYANNYTPTDWQSNGSFACYLIEKYGKDEYLESYKNKLIFIDEKNESTLRNEWRAWLTEVYEN